MIGRFSEELGLTPVVAATVPEDSQQAMAISLALKATVLEVVTRRDPLYRRRSWAEKLPLDFLMGTGVELNHLNESSIARHLDRFFAAGPETIFNAAALRASDVEGLALSPLHDDATTRLVLGSYSHPDDQAALAVAYGDTKDQRTDLQQVMLGRSTTTDGDKSYVLQDCEMLGHHVQLGAYRVRPPRM